MSEARCLKYRRKRTRFIASTAYGVVYSEPTTHCFGKIALPSTGSPPRRGAAPTGLDKKKAPELSGAFKAAITYSSAFAVPSA